MEDEKLMVGMTDNEKTEYVIEQAMKIILSSGDARTYASKAFDAICEGRYDDAEAMLKEAEKTQTVAHNIQTAMIQGDIRGDEEQLGYYVLFAHAQDTLMTIQVEINLTKSILRLARANDMRISTLEKKLA